MIRVTPLLPDGTPDHSRAMTMPGTANFTMPGVLIRDERQAAAEDLVRDGAIAYWNGAQR